MPPKREDAPFKYLTKGMHKYKDIETVPFDYLEWCLDNWSSEDDPTNYQIVEEEFIRRKRGGR